MNKSHGGIGKIRQHAVGGEEIENAAVCFLTAALYWRLYDIQFPHEGILEDAGKIDVVLACQRIQPTGDCHRFFDGLLIVFSVIRQFIERNNDYKLFFFQWN